MRVLDKRIKQLSKVTAVASCSLVLACGSTEEQEKTVPGGFGTLTLADSQASNDNGTFALSSVEKCSRDLESGRVDVIISQGAAKPSIILAIKDFSSSPKTYDCRQAVDNRESTTELGGKFESCMVETKVPSAPEATTLNAYSMYRESLSTKPFSYSGRCTIQVTSVAPSIVGKINCLDLVQTMLEGTPRNPIDSNIRADLTADFSCAFR